MSLRTARSFRTPFTAVLALLAFAGALQAQHSGSDWSKLQAIAAGTQIRVSSLRRPTVCSFITADTTSLTCTRTQTIFFIPITRRLLFPKGEVSTVKLSRQALSAFSAAGIGAGVGAGIGAGLDSQSSSREDGHLLTVVLAFLGAGLGVGFGASTDFLAGPTVYRRP